MFYAESFDAASRMQQNLNGKFESQAKINKVDLDMFKYRSPAEAEEGVGKGDRIKF